VFDAVRSILIGPFDRLSFTIIEANIAHDFAIEIFDRRENPASNKVALNFGEPDFNLIKPGRISWDVVNANVGVAIQESADGLGLMGAQVIADDMNGLMPWLTSQQIFQKSDKFGAGVPCGGLPDDLSGAGMQSRVERKSAVPIIFKPMAFSPAWRERQDRIQAVQRLNGTLLIDAKNRRIDRGLKVKADDIGRLFSNSGSGLAR